MNMEAGRLKLEECKQELQIIADLFYQNKIEDGVNKLPDLIRMLNKIMEQECYEDKSKFWGILKNVTECIDSKNYIMLADIIVFELLAA